MFQKVSKETIESWKEEYGEGNVLILNVGGGKVYLSKPSASPNYFHTAKRAIQLQHQQDLLSAGEVVFNESYLGGLGQLNKIKKSTSVYVNICVQCNDLVELLEANFTTA